MPIQASLSSTTPAKAAADVLAVPVFSGRVLGPGSLASNLYVVGFGGEIVELPGATALPAA